MLLTLYQRKKNVINFPPLSFTLSYNCTTKFRCSLANIQYRWKAHLSILLYLLMHNTIPFLCGEGITYTVFWRVSYKATNQPQLRGTGLGSRSPKIFFLLVHHLASVLHQEESWPTLSSSAPIFWVLLLFFLPFFPFSLSSLTLHGFSKSFYIIILVQH